MMRLLALSIPADSSVLAPVADEAHIFEASTPGQADAVLAQGGIDVIAARATSWGLEWVQTLSDETRPAVVFVGDTPERAIAEGDDWIADGASVVEVRARLHAAIRRGRTRRRAVRRGNVDHLTALPNRRGVMIALLRGAAQSRRRGSRLSVVLVDLDYFKRINELQGHDAGDRVLRRVGRVLRRATRQDEVCGRVGGDEFVVVVQGDGPHAELVARRISALLMAEGVSATTASCELAPSESLRELYRRVDAQLRARKRIGRPPLEHATLGH